MEAETARANAISLEAKKDGLTQRQNGDWSLRLTIASLDMDQRIAIAPMGTRYILAIVEIADDETPVDHASMQRDKWRELGPVKQAGIRCKDPVFWSWLREEMHYPVINEDNAATAVKHFCGVASRADLAKPGKTNERERWYSMDYKFQAWKVKDAA